jgi:hypothetical protein
MIRTLKPTGRGALFQLTPAGAASNWDCVDDNPHNGDTDYVHITTSGTMSEVIQADSHIAEDLPAGLLGVISRVTVKLVARYVTLSAGHAKATPRVRLGTTLYSGTEVDLTGSYVEYVKDWTTRPSDGQPWTVSDVNGAQPGYLGRALDNGAPTVIRFTQALLIVEHERIFGPTSSIDLLLVLDTPEFDHPGPGGAPPKLSAQLPFTQTGSGATRRTGGTVAAAGPAAAGSAELRLSTSAIFALELFHVESLPEDF